VASPQTGIFALGTSSHAYLELDLVAGVEAGAAASLVASLREPRTTIGGVNVVAGFRPELWASLMPGGAPAGVTGFNAPLSAAGGHLPATQHDIVVWLTGSVDDVVFDLEQVRQSISINISKIRHLFFMLSVIRRLSKRWRIGHLHELPRMSVKAVEFPRRIDGR